MTGFATKELTLEHSRLRWGCRRGMLELDMHLLPFFDHCFEALSEEEQATFAALLEVEDPTLNAWFIHQEPAGDDKLQAMVDKIKAYAKSHPST